MTTRGRQRPLGSIVYHMADDDALSSRALCYQYLRGWVGATSEIYADVNGVQRVKIIFKRFYVDYFKDTFYNCSTKIYNIVYLWSMRYY